MYSSDGLIEWWIGFICGGEYSGSGGEEDRETVVVMVNRKIKEEGAMVVKD